MTRTVTKPTHELKAKDVETGDYGKIGVGWMNEDGSVSIKLSPCVTVSYDNLKGKVLTLFPILTDAEWAAKGRTKLNKVVPE